MTLEYKILIINKFAYFIYLSIIILIINSIIKIIKPYKNIIFNDHD
jgi:uncharacterized membrane protein YcgQ (UPF0703/DUF1980 family)